MSDHYFILTDKRRYIEEDFKVNGPYRLGVLPDDPAARPGYIAAVKASTFSWLAKYEQNSQRGYALELASDFISNIERSVRTC